MGIYPCNMCISCTIILDIVQGAREIKDDRNLSTYRECCWSIRNVTYDWNPPVVWNGFCNFGSYVCVYFAVEESLSLYIRLMIIHAA